MAFLSWSYNYRLMIQGILVSLGVALVVKGLLTDTFADLHIPLRAHGAARVEIPFAQCKRDELRIISCSARPVAKKQSWGKDSIILIPSWPR